MTEEVQAPTKPTVIEALSAAMAEVQAVGKGGRNLDQGYDFRGVDAVVNAVGPVFRSHGIVPIPHKVTANYRDVQTSRGKPSRECTVTTTYRFYGPAGDYVEAEVPGESMDSGDKGAAKAMSVAYRILLLQSLCIPTGEPDPDASSYERDNERPNTRPDPVTDPAWLDRMEKAIEVAAAVDTLERIRNEIRAEHLAGKVSEVHSQHLLHLYQQRYGQVAGAAA